MYANKLKKEFFGIKYFTFDLINLSYAKRNTI